MTYRRKEIIKWIAFLPLAIVMSPIIGIGMFLWLYREHLLDRLMWAEDKDIDNFE